MTLTSLISEQLKREAVLTRRALERVPEGKNDWKPHPKSMPLGQLAHMIGLMPSWVSMMIKQDELDIKPKEGSSGPRTIPSTADLVKSHEKAVNEALQAIAETTDEKLQTTWKLLEGGTVVQESSRYQFILDHFGHTAHHRGQLTVYLRLNEAEVPAIYGPSADDHRF
jgi:uncharacterized damage-inducible protein DinB